MRKKAGEALIQINKYLKETDSKLTMTIKQVYEAVTKNEKAIVAPPKKPTTPSTPKKPGENNIVPFIRNVEKIVQPRKTGTGDDDDNTACNGMNRILRTLEYPSLPESFQKTGEFPEYNIIVCISNKIPSKKQLTAKIREDIQRARNDIGFRHKEKFDHLPIQIFPLKETATIYVSSFGNENDLIVALQKSLDNLMNGKPSNNKNKGNNSVTKGINNDTWWFFSKIAFYQKNTILLLRNFSYEDVAHGVYGVANQHELRRFD
jgi:hypothetical protein